MALKIDKQPFSPNYLLSFWKKDLKMVIQASIIITPNAFKVAGLLNTNTKIVLKVLTSILL